MPFLNGDGEVVELHLGARGEEISESNPENRFRADWLDEVDALLDQVVADPTRPLVITATGKFFSNGLDTDHIFAAPDQLPGYLDRVHALYAKVLTRPRVAARRPIGSVATRPGAIRSGHAISER